ncbi:tRNA lysidine(34) synthetase TilS [Pandoraea vervacti]|uniref:tRNA lysidine(34) synthetase TilS n=1 Tax=Pandoraea vervacti TaxID=656178 RepID=UPI001428C0A8|nr:tRNA lysidine(34) synthetase TilS [Pandoraea vervacti]
MDVALRLALTAHVSPHDVTHVSSADAAATSPAPSTSSTSSARSVLPRLALALSGGLDSMVLLDALAHWWQKRRERGDAGAQPLAIHVHHGLSEHADEWLAVCEREARLRGFAFEAQRVRVPRGARQGIEGAARAVRYEALAASCRRHGVDWLLSAHHANDQAETVLLQMLRGAGLPGVAAMAIEGDLPLAARESNHVRLLRPLLDVSRETMRAYATARSLTWVEDPSNEDRHYLRNALRHDVMPAIASHVPAYRETLARFARHAAQAQTLLDQLAQVDFEMARVARAAREVGAGHEEGDDRLQRSRLQGLDAPRLANLLRYWAASRGLPMPPEARLDEWVRQIRDAHAQASLELPHGDAVLRVYRDELQWTAVYDVARADDVIPDAVLHWAGEREWRLPQWRGSIVFTPVPEGEPTQGDIGEHVLRAGPLVAKARVGGERWRARADGRSRSLKHWYQSRGVAAWLRHVPVVWQKDIIVFVPRLGVDGGVQSEEGGTRWTMAWRDEA